MRLDNIALNNMEIEHASLSDAKSIAALWSKIDIDSSFQPFGGNNIKEKTERSLEMIKHAINADNACVLKIRNKNSIIGTISAHVFERPTVKITPIGVIYSLWVNESYRNQGIGQQLLTSVEQTLTSMGAKAFQVGWDISNTHASRWWQKRGYKAYETIACKTSDID